MGALAAELAETALERGHLLQQGAERGDGIHAGLGHRPVSHAPANGDPRPDDAALLETHLVLLRLADDRRAQRTADRGRAEVLDADHLPFLVDERAEYESPAERRPAALDGGRCDHHRGDAALHVGGAPSVDAPVGHLGGEGRMRPLGRIAFRDDVRVAFQKEAASAFCLAEPGEHVGPAGRDLLHLEIKPLLGQPGFDVARDGRFGGRRISRTDDAGNANELSRELDELRFVDTG